MLPSSNEADSSLAFVETIVKECSNFFLNLHTFCERYSHRLSLERKETGLPPHSRKASEQIKSIKTKKISKEKKPATLYMAFFREQTKMIKEKGGNKLDGRKLARLIASKWKKLSSEERNKYSLTEIATSELGEHTRKSHRPSGIEEELSESDREISNKDSQDVSEKEQQSLQQSKSSKSQSDQNSQRKFDRLTQVTSIYPKHQIESSEENEEEEKANFVPDVKVKSKNFKKSKICRKNSLN